MRNFVYKVFSMNFEVLEYVMMVKWMVGKSDIDDHVCGDIRIAWIAWPKDGIHIVRMVWRIKRWEMSWEFSVEMSNQGAEDEIVVLSHGISGSGIVQRNDQDPPSGTLYVIVGSGCS